ncbi:MAG: hypothetical protein J6P82_00780 [Bacteroidales bacterium]|nr:hypothetical protein [Bacteroidales bacterium]
MYKISSASLSTMTQADFQGFCSQYDGLLTTYGDTSLGIEQTFIDQFRSLLESYSDCCKDTTASVLTAQLQTADELRTRLYRGVRAQLANCRNASKTEVTSLYPRILRCVLNVYGADITSESVNKKTGYISGFVRDVRKLGTGNLQTLGITADLEALSQANQAYLEQSVQRSVEEGQTPKAVAKKLREQLVDCIDVMDSSLFYWANLVQPATDQQTIYQELSRQFINALNDVISRIRRTARADSSAETTGTGTTAENSGTTSGTTSETASGSAESGSTESGSTESGNNGTTESGSSSGSTESSGTTGSETTQGSDSTEQSGSSDNPGTTENTNTGGTDDDGDDDDDDVFA